MHPNQDIHALSFIYGFTGWPDEDPVPIYIPSNTVIHFNSPIVPNSSFLQDYRRISESTQTANPFKVSVRDESVSQEYFDLWYTTISTKTSRLALKTRIPNFKLDHPSSHKINSEPNSSSFRHVYILSFNPSLLMKLQAQCCTSEKEFTR